MKRFFDWKNWPSFVKLLITLLVLGLCFLCFLWLNGYIQLVPQPAPDGTFLPITKGGA